MNAIGGFISASSSSSLLSVGPSRFFSYPLFSYSSPSSKTLISTYWNNKTYKAIPQFSSSPAASLSTTAAAGAAITAASPSEVLVAEPMKPKPQPWLIVGLGNPGKMYSGTRHNDRNNDIGVSHHGVVVDSLFARLQIPTLARPEVGFEMVDAIAEAEGISMSSVSFKARFGKGFIGNVPVMLAKPQTFMNASGDSVGAIVSYHKIPLKQVLVIFDDLDLPFAKLRLLPKGGHGGHNGMRSVIDRLKGSRDFPRLRIGIGRPPGKMDPVSFVMRSFNKQEREELDFTFQNGIKAVRILLVEGIEKAATFVNSAKHMEQLS